MASFKETRDNIMDIVSKMDRNEKKMVIKFIIMHDLKLYMEVLHEEQLRLEQELGIKGVEEYTEFDNGDAGHAKDGFLGYVDGEGRF